MECNLNKYRNNTKIAFNTFKLSSNTLKLYNIIVNIYNLQDMEKGHYHQTIEKSGLVQVAWCVLDKRNHLHSILRQNPKTKVKSKQTNPLPKPTCMIILWATNISRRPSLCFKVKPKRATSIFWQTEWRLPKGHFIKVILLFSLILWKCTKKHSIRDYCEIFNFCIWTNFVFQRDFIFSTLHYLP